MLCAQGVYLSLIQLATALVLLPPLALGLVISTHRRVCALEGIFKKISLGTRALRADAGGYRSTLVYSQVILKSAARAARQILVSEFSQKFAHM
jgi:hypothetical protein